MIYEGVNVYIFKATKLKGEEGELMKGNFPKQKMWLVLGNEPAQTHTISHPPLANMNEPVTLEIVNDTLKTFVKPLKCQLIEIQHRRGVRDIVSLS